MGKRENFTSERIGNFKCAPAKQQSIFWDGKTPGLGLRVTATGAKSYIFETSLHGKTLRLTIGDTRTWSISKAQEEARRLKTETDKGNDPRQQKANMRTQAEEALKASNRIDIQVLTAWDAYIEARKHKWSARHLADHATLTQPGGEKRKRAEGYTQPGALAALMAEKLRNLDSDHVKAWLKVEANRRPTQARLAYNRLRAFLNWCADNPDYRGIASVDACKASVARDILPKSKAKTDALQKQQLQTWFSAVQSIGNPIISAYLQSLLLTGARREELACLRWQDIDFKWQTIKIHDKVEGERTIPLTPYVGKLFSDLKTRSDTPPAVFRILHGKRIENDLANWKPSHWVFASPTAKATGGRLTEPRIAHTKALNSAGLPHVSLNGLRRSFGTLAEWVECPTGIAAQIMGHKPSATAEKHYRVRPIDLLRKWHTTIENWILEQANITFELPIISLKIVA